MGARINRRLATATALTGLALTGAAGGLLDSADASSTPAPIVIRITKVTEKHRKITVSGQITPSGAVVRANSVKPYVILSRLQGANTYYQLSYTTSGVVSPRGTFTIKSVTDAFGPLRRNTYALLFNPAPASGYSQFIKTFRLRLTK